MAGAPEKWKSSEGKRRSTASLRFNKGGHNASGNTPSHRQPLSLYPHRFAVCFIRCCKRAGISYKRLHTEAAFTPTECGMVSG
jgi:hypothetical protein